MAEASEEMPTRRLCLKKLTKGVRHHLMSQLLRNGEEVCLVRLAHALKAIVPAHHASSYYRERIAVHRRKRGEETITAPAQQIVPGYQHMVRTCLSRPLLEGWVLRTKRDGRPYYSITAEGIKRLEADKAVKPVHDDEQSRSNHKLVKALQKSIASGTNDIATISASIVEMFEREPPAFCERYDPSRKQRWSAKREQFLEFVAAPVPDGLGTTVKELRKMLKGKARTLLELAVARGPGGANNPKGLGGHTGKEQPAQPEEGLVNRDNVTVDKSGPVRQGGNATSYALDRLRRDRPDLLARVNSEELTVNAASKLAGHRKDPPPVKQFRKIIGKATPEELKEMLALIQAKISEGSCPARSRFAADSKAGK